MTLGLAEFAASRKFRTILADPPWRFSNRTGKIAPEYGRAKRYPTMSLRDIAAMPISEISDEKSHLYLWVPNALLPEGIDVLRAWGFGYKSNIVWYKTAKNGGPDRRGVGFYFRNTTEICLFGVKGKGNRTREAGRRQSNIIEQTRTIHSAKPDGLYEIAEQCSHEPYLEIFARRYRQGWHQWGNECFTSPEGQFPIKCAAE